MADLTAWYPRAMARGPIFARTCGAALGGMLTGMTGCSLFEGPSSYADAGASDASDAAAIVEAAPLDAGDGAPAAVDGCTPPSATLPTGCPTFTRDIWGKLMITGGAWGCQTTQCHGANANPPKLLDVDSAYTTLLAYRVDGGKPYINPACVEADQSAFECNTAAKPAACGARMPLVTVPGSHLPTPAEIETLENWITCGSPK